MLRSTVNHLIADAIQFFHANKYNLPPFAAWSPADWSRKGAEVEEIVACRLGWDVTDFGMGDFYRYGILLFTVRNGSLVIAPHKPYAEKVMIAEVGQEHQMHYHARKMEDIINRNGGRLVMSLFRSMPDGSLSSEDVLVSLDGVRVRLHAGENLVLNPGESITIPQGCYHKFWAEKARVLMGEVSMVNNDENDNYFYRPFGSGRFQSIVEDEDARYLLGNETNKYWSKGALR